MDRRNFLQTAGWASVGLAFGPRPLLHARLAEGSHGAATDRVLVTIFLRGAMDGLAAIQPAHDEHLLRLRPSLALATGPAGRTDGPIDLGTGHLMHPGLAALHPAWTAGELSIIHGVGSPHPSRSHFDAQDFMESGTPGIKGTASGWLGRLANHVGAPPQGLMHALSMTPSLPRSLHGHPGAIAVDGLANVRLRVPRRGRRVAERALRDTSSIPSGPVGAAWDDALRLLEEVDGLKQSSGNHDFPASGLGRALRDIGQVIRSDIGLRIAFAEMDGWDTHVRQGGLRGQFAAQAREFADALSAFWSSLGSHRDRVAVLVLTEFGRTVRENGAHGTDHGRASCAFVLSKRITPGRILGGLPSLAPENLADGRDLPVTVDFRRVCSALAQGHLGIDAPIFPGWGGKPLDIFPA